jgi:hypothetical protein
MTKEPRAVSSDAVYMLEQAVKKSKRSSGIQLPPGFVSSQTDGDVPPLARILRGGRGGEVRLKLYLTMILIAVRAPYKIESVPTRAWAETLDLDDPDGLGARRISDALQWLAKEHFIERASRRGSPPAVTLRSVLGDGTPFVRGAGIYLSVPLGLWKYHWIVKLSGTGLALLLVLLDLQGGSSSWSPPSLPGPRRRRYGLSDDTWTRASRELKALGLLQIRKKPQGQVFDSRRMRNTYWIDKAKLNAPIPDA